MIETSIIDVPMNTWWLDTRATLHVTNSLQGMISQRGPTNLEQHVYMGDNSRVKVDIMGIIKLKLATGYVLELQEVSYIPSIRGNFLSLSLLDSQGYSFLFENNKVEMYKDGKVVGFITVAVYIDLIYLIMVSIILLILLLLLNAQELMIIPQYYGISI